MTAAEFTLPDAPPRDPAWPALLPPVLSPSSLTTFLACPEQFRRVYVRGERSRTSGALVIGDADSQAAAHNFGLKIASHADLPKADVEYVAAEAFDKRVDAEGGLGEVDWEDKKPGEEKDLAVRVAGSYLEQAARFVQPESVETELRLQVEGVPVAVRGYADVIGDDATVGGRRVIERKTASRRAAVPKQGWVAQSAIYSAAAGAPTSFHVTTKTKQPEACTPASDSGLVAHDDGLAAERAARLVTLAARGMVAYLETFGPESAWPTPPALAPFGSICSYCAFRASCPAWR